jgi:hypothetical protein
MVRVFWFLACKASFSASSSTTSTVRMPRGSYRFPMVLEPGFHRTEKRLCAVSGNSMSPLQPLMTSDTMNATTEVELMFVGILSVTARAVFELEEQFESLIIPRKIGFLLYIFQLNLIALTSVAMFPVSYSPRFRRRKTFSY